MTTPTNMSRVVQREVGSPEDFSRLNLIGASRAFLDALDLIRKYAAYEATVLIQGETGTGKELAARAIHYMSARRDMPFIPVNCGALPDSLLESEFFGHVRGAFTDAREARPGLITQARGGTLFLDEIEAMTPRAQVTLLRFLQDKDYRPLGGATISTDVRVVGSTNADLRAAARQGKFRADLLFRLDVLPLRLPALKDRAGDVMVLVDSFLDRLNRQSGGPLTVLHAASVPVLNAYSWPGNVRELENLIQREFILSSESPVIHIFEIDGESAAGGSERSTGPEDEAFKAAKARAVAHFERQYLLELLSRTAGNISLASRISGKDRSDIAKLLRKYGIERRQFTDILESVDR